jgi:hypothetical protein
VFHVARISCCSESQGTESDGGMARVAGNGRGLLGPADKARGGANGLDLRQTWRAARASSEHIGAATGQGVRARQEKNQRTGAGCVRLDVHPLALWLDICSLLLWIFFFMFHRVRA